jgi:hypothetical protein
MIFTDNQIRRNDLPRDAFQLIHDLAYDHEGRDRKDYRKRAQAILKSDVDITKSKPNFLARKRVGISARVKANRGIDKQLDNCARILCFARDHNKCIRCGGESNLQWAHVKTRGVVGLRWELINNMTLDAGCHLWWHNRPDESGPWFKETFPERWEHIQIALRNKIPVDRQLLLICLQAEVRALDITG